MTVILGLSHFIGLMVGSLLSRLGLKKDQRKRMGGPTFKKLLVLIEKVALSDPFFYSQLHFNLPKIN